MNEVNEESKQTDQSTPPPPKENVAGAWILILALAVIPILIKYIFLNE